METERVSNTAGAAGVRTGVLWVLILLLATVFLTVGLSKLLGTGPIVFQAAAMHGFPNWIRVVVGVVEVSGAIALLVPRLSTYGAIGLALLMIPATITQAMSGEPGVYVPIIVFVLLLTVAWLRNPAGVREAYRSVVATPRPILREGTAAGVIGATCIAAWFFVIDLIAGHPLFTPATLGRAFFAVLRPTPPDIPQAVQIGVYTVFHYAAFIVVGTIAASVARAAHREPALLLGFVILFVAFEVGFYALVAILQQATPLGALAWYQVMAGNVIAAAAMGFYIWRAHPALRHQFAHAFDPQPNTRS